MDEFAHFRVNNPVLSDYTVEILVFSGYCSCLLSSLMIFHGRDKQLRAFRLVKEERSSKDIPLISAAASATNDT
jgi:mannose/fructose-specific phosphotransferase system component IIA